MLALTMYFPSHLVAFFPSPTFFPLTLARVVQGILDGTPKVGVTCCT